MIPDHQALHRKVRALGRTREQLEPMVHSGTVDAHELWDQLEKRWRNLESQAKHLTRGTEDMRDGVADMIRGNVTELRKGYERLASALRGPRSESIWSQVRISLGRLVPGGHRTRSLDADIRKAAPEFLDPDRLEA